MVTALLCLSSAIASAQAPFDFVPKPASVQYADASVSAPFVLDKNVRIEGGEAFNVQYLKDHLARLFDPMGDSWATGGRTISFVRVKSFPQEGYSLEVTPDRILISASTRTGEFYAVQTLLQMLPPQVYQRTEGPDAQLLRQWEIPCVQIVDQPRFPWRGSMLDVSRSFFSKEYIVTNVGVM